MGSNKEKEFKDFLISSRKKIGSGMTNAPIWVLRKAGERIWNPKQKRHWKNVDLGFIYRKRKKTLVMRKRKPKVKKKLKYRKPFERKQRKTSRLEN